MDYTRERPFNTVIKERKNILAGNAKLLNVLLQLTRASSSVLASGSKMHQRRYEIGRFVNLLNSVHSGSIFNGTWTIVNLEFLIILSLILRLQNFKTMKSRSVLLEQVQRASMEPIVS